MAKFLDTEGFNRIRAAAIVRETSGRAVEDARHLWSVTRTDNARELWRMALLQEQKAEAEYWAVTGEYFEDLGPSR